MLIDWNDMIFVEVEGVDPVLSCHYNISTFISPNIICKPIIWFITISAFLAAVLHLVIQHKVFHTNFSCINKR